MSNGQKPLPRHPVRVFYGETMQTTISALISGKERLDRILDAEGYTGRRVMGYKLPRWQRKDTWTEEQAIRFIESIYMGACLGTYMINESETDPEIDGIVLDAQQRLLSLEKYINDEFRVPAPDGNAYLWSDLTESERAHFYRIPWAWIQTHYNSEQLCVDAYNRHNYGGTAHLESEYATL